jgi:hypothetical protein
MGEIEKTIFQGVDWHWELNICLLAIPKYDLCEVEKSMFLGVEILCEIIYIQKFDLDEVEEAMFHVFEWPWELIICLLDVAKCEFGKVDKTIFQVVQKT